MGRAACPSASMSGEDHATGSDTAHMFPFVPESASASAYHNPSYCPMTIDIRATFSTHAQEQDPHPHPHPHPRRTEHSVGSFQSDGAAVCDSHAQNRMPCSSTRMGHAVVLQPEPSGYYDTFRCYDARTMQPSVHVPRVEPAVPLHFPHGAPGIPRRTSGPPTANPHNWSTDFGHALATLPNGNAPTRNYVGVRAQPEPCVDCVAFPEKTMATELEHGISAQHAACNEGDRTPTQDPPSPLLMLNNMEANKMRSIEEVFPQFVEDGCLQQPGYGALDTPQCWINDAHGPQPRTKWMEDAGGPGTMSTTRPLYDSYIPRSIWIDSIKDADVPETSTIWNAGVSETIASSSGGESPLYVGAAGLNSQAPSANMGSVVSANTSSLGPLKSEACSPPTPGQGRGADLPVARTVSVPALFSRANCVCCTRTA